MYEIIGEAFCILVGATGKCAVSAFLLRIVFKRTHVLMLWFFIVSTCGLTILCAITFFVQCIPVQANWNPNVKGNCWLDFTKLGITTASWTTVMDFVQAIFPCFVVWGLRMKRKEKMTVVLGLGLGLLSVLLFTFTDSDLPGFQCWTALIQ